LEVRVFGAEVFLRDGFRACEVLRAATLSILNSVLEGWLSIGRTLLFFGMDSIRVCELIGLLRAGSLASRFSSCLAKRPFLVSLHVRHFVFRWAITTVAVMVASALLHGIRYDTVPALITAALLLGILNAFVRPVLLILSAPLILLTLGFFILIVNGLMLLIVPGIVTGFHVDSFGSAFWGAIVISIVSWLLSAFFRGSDGRVHVLTHHTQVRRVRGRVIEPGKQPPD
jgi:putative membrane protein